MKSGDLFRREPDLAQLFLLGHTNSLSLVSGGLGVLTPNPEAPVVPQTSVGTDLLQTLQVLTELVVQQVSHHLVGLAILNVPLPVKEPVGNLILARVLHDGNNLLNLFLRKLSGPLVQRNVGLLQNNVGIPTSDTLDGSKGEHDVGFSINVCVEDTKNMRECGWHDQRHSGDTFLLSLLKIT